MYEHELSEASRSVSDITLFIRLRGCRWTPQYLPRAIRVAPLLHTPVGPRLLRGSCGSADLIRNRVSRGGTISSLA